jgi:hypothetical protein
MNALLASCENRQNGVIRPIPGTLCSLHLIYLNAGILCNVTEIRPFLAYYPPEFLDQIVKGKRPSVAGHVGILSNHTICFLTGSVKKHFKVLPEFQKWQNSHQKSLSLAQSYC